MKYNGRLSLSFFELQVLHTLTKFRDDQIITVSRADIFGQKCPNSLSEVKSKYITIMTIQKKNCQ